MTFARAQAMADAILYEGYMLYPYRSSALKNRHRWTFGVIHPRAESSARGGGEPWCLQSECLVLGSATSAVEGRVRFLHPALASSGGWHAHPCEVDIEPVQLVELEGQKLALSLPCRHGDQASVEGKVELSALRTVEGFFKLTVRVLNLTPVPVDDRMELDYMVARSMVSTHVLLGLRRGEFVPPRDSPPSLSSAVEGCRNAGLWPILLGEPGARDMMLCSPIILDDYPRIAPESPGNLFDGTEIDEILTLRILTLTPEEKAEIATEDEAVRALLARTEALQQPEIARLHGTMRVGPNEERPLSLQVRGCELSAGDKVRLRPRGRSDIFDIALTGRVATIVSVEQDFEDRAYLAVIVDDDPGRDLGTTGNPGHRFFFFTDEVEPLIPDAD